MIMTINECAGWLKERDGFLILTHRRPDGDTIGSASALARSLRQAGKTAYLLENPEITAKYRSFAEEFHAPEGFCAEHIITVDTASEEMLQINAQPFAGKVTLAIDHHGSNTMYAAHTVLEPERAACGELIYEIAYRIGPVDAQTATALYVAVATDTGCFSYENTNAGAFFIASKLVEAGADAAELNKYLFRSKTRGRIAVEAMVFSSMQFLFDGKAAIAVITNEMIKGAEVTEDDLENIAAFTVMVEGVSVGATVRELDGGGCKVSMRSGPDVDSNAICARFGGGGHFSASGFTTDALPHEVRLQLIPILGEFLGYDGDY